MDIKEQRTNLQRRIIEVCLMATTIKSRKAKGRNLQNIIASKIIDAFNLSDHDVRGAIMGETGVDIKLSKEARSVFPFAVEAKARKSFSMYSVFDQANRHAARESLSPLVIIKADYKKPLVVIDMDLFLSILK